jgi:hypothetical protein
MDSIVFTLETLNLFLEKYHTGSRNLSLTELYNELEGFYLLNMERLFPPFSGF